LLRLSAERWGQGKEKLVTLNKKEVKMKKFTIFLMALVAVNGLFAQWVTQNSGTTENLNSVFFTDVNTGYVVGDSGIILKTSDGGQLWTNLNSGKIYNLKSVFFIDPNIGYVTGDSGTILMTNNAGTSWVTQTSGTYNCIYSIYFADATTGYVVGQGGTILKTNDAGITWLDISTNNTYTLASVFFTDPNTGYATGSKPYGWGGCGIILKTVNGGNDWVPCYENCSQFGASCYNICFPNINTGYAIAYEYEFENTWSILKTINGGTDWTSIGSAIAAYSLCFSSPDTGYIVGHDIGNISGDFNILKTVNGGENWTDHYSGTNNSLYAVFFTDSDTGYVAGEGGTIQKTSNGGGFPVGIEHTTSTVSTFLKIFPNPSSNIITVETIAKGHLSILNLNGQQLITRQITEPIATLDIRTLPTGIYVVKVVGESRVQVGKFIKQ
jgi:photosystem II stability/assembly factor-like uncharacterized protein